MRKRTRILFLSANPWTTSRILVDEEAREIFEKLQEGSCRDSFELQKHTATRAIDLQRLLMMYKPHIVHFSAHGSKRQRIILGGTRGRGKQVDPTGLVELFGLYRRHVRLVFLNACFTKTQAESLCQVIDYSVGTGKMIGDKGGVAFAAAFYRALSFGKSVKEAFKSAKVELEITKIPRSNGLELFVRDGLTRDSFPKRNEKRPSKRSVSTRPSSSRTGPVRRPADLRPRVPMLSPDGISCGLRASSREATRSYGEWNTHVRCMRMETLNSVSSVALKGPRRALKKAPKRRADMRQWGLVDKEPSLMCVSVFADEMVSSLRVFATERFESVMNDASEE